MADLQFADDRDVVFSLAGNDAGAAPGADVQVHRHAPLLRRVQGRMRVERRKFFRQLFVARDLHYEILVCAVTIERRLAHQSAAFDAPMLLRDGQRVLGPGLFNLDAFHRFPVGHDEMRIENGAQEIGVEPNLVRRHG